MLIDIKHELATISLEKLSLMASFFKAFSLYVSVFMMDFLLENAPSISMTGGYSCPVVSTGSTVTVPEVMLTKVLTA